jgi:CMP-N,N'-diacetyllegionaminic acid synthase
MIDVTCIIPARGGSKRLPNKNILPLNGKPLIAYSIEAWNKSKYYKYPAIISTEDPMIAAKAWDYDAEVIMRPTSLAQDDTPTLPVIRHVIDTFIRYYTRRIHWIIILQPTSPLRTVEDIDICLDIINDNQADSLTSVNPEGKENGAIYITHADLIMRGTLYGPGLHKYVMPAERSVDIDTLEDLKEAERILKGEGDDHSGSMLQLGQSGHGKGNDKNGKGKRGRAR